MSSDQTCAHAARFILSARKARQTYFGQHMFDEFAWNMLLALFIAQVDERRLDQAALYHASDTNATVGYRWLRFLESQRMVVIHAENGVALTADSVERLRTFLADIAAVVPV